MRNLLFLLSLLCFLSSFSLSASARDDITGAMEAVGERISDVRFEGDELPEPVRARFVELSGKKFNPALVRSILVWYHENGGESRVTIEMEPSRGGYVLLVTSRLKERVEKIVIEGNNSVPTNTMLSVIDVKEGNDFEKEDVEASVQKLSTFYSKQGYLASSVTYTYDPKTRTLTFKVVEGEPTLLAGFGISPLTTIEKKELRDRYESDLEEAFGLKVGDRIQRDRVMDGIQAVKDWLREHDFLLAKDPVLEYKVNEQGQVNLFLNINYGSRIRYGFRGNKQFSYRELISLVGEVKEVSSGADYLAAVRRRLLEAYREIGFVNAQISSLVREDTGRGIRYISLIISEGEKVRIDRLTIDGIFSMSPDEARKKLYSLGTRLVQRGYFHETGITRAAELFAEYLRSQGYLSAKLEYLKHDFNEKRTKVNVSLLFNEGIQTWVQGVDITGVKSFRIEEVHDILGLKVGQPFDIFAFEKGLLTLKEKYQELGNLNAQITNEASDDIVRYSKDNSQVFIHIEVDEGPVYQVGEVIVRGNKKTHARVITRELPFIAGDILTQPLLSEAEDNIKQLNLFSSVIVRPIDKAGSSNVKDILILIEESEPGSFDIIPGFRNDLGLRLGFELGYQNLGGWNRSVSARAIFNRRLEEYRFPEYNFSLGFKEPYLANWPVVFTSNLTLLRRQFNKFDATVGRFVMGVKRDLMKHLSGFLEYSYEQVKVRNAQEPYTKEDEREDFIGSITPGLIIDSRNDLYNPSKGFYSINRFEIASRYFGSERSVGFYRATSYSSTYFELYDNIVLALAMNIGWERSNIAGEKIPAFRLFRLGGLGSIRGYAEDSIEVESTKNVTGILGLVNYRGELRIPVSGNFGTAMFIDAGNLMVDRFAFRPERLRSSAGVGFRYLTPVGPVVLDFAHKLQTDTQVGDIQVRDTDRYRIHFSIGTF